MRFMMGAAVAAALLAAAATASAADTSAAPEGPTLTRMTDGFTYFNRPGADMAAMDEALIGCLAEARTTSSMDELVNGPGLFAAMTKGQPFGAAAENCMVVRGWRVVRLPEDEGAALSKETPEAVATKLGEWVGQATPHGEVARVWANEAARGSTQRYEVRAWGGGKGSLSVLSLGDRAKAPPKDEKKPDAPEKVTLDKSWPTKPLKPAEIANAPAQTGVVIFGVKGISLHNGVGLGFNRMGADNSWAPSKTDHAPDMLFVAGRWGHAEGFLTAMALPPGKWRMTNLGMMPALSLCLGSPSFELKAGEVVYAGMFDMGSENLGPDLTLEPVKAFLAGTPAAETVKAASYTNGSTSPCGGSFIYAYEIPGAPYEPGYAWGGAAK